jgi:hypothetical protein
MIQLFAVTINVFQFPPILRSLEWLLKIRYLGKHILINLYPNYVWHVMLLGQLNHLCVKKI